MRKQIIVDGKPAVVDFARDPSPQDIAAMTQQIRQIRAQASARISAKVQSLFGTGALGTALAHPAASGAPTPGPSTPSMFQNVLDAIEAPYKAGAKVGDAATAAVKPIGQAIGRGLQSPANLIHKEYEKYVVPALLNTEGPKAGGLAGRAADWMKKNPNSLVTSLATNAPLYMTPGVGQVAFGADIAHAGGTTLAEGPAAGAKEALMTLGPAAILHLAPKVLPGAAKALWRYVSKGEGNGLAAVKTAREAINGGADPAHLAKVLGDTPAAHSAVASAVGDPLMRDRPDVVAYAKKHGLTVVGQTPEGKPVVRVKSPKRIAPESSATAGQAPAALPESSGLPGQAPVAMPEGSGISGQAPVGAMPSATASPSMESTAGMGVPAVSGSTEPSATEPGPAEPGPAIPGRPSAPVPEAKPVAPVESQENVTPGTSNAQIPAAETPAPSAVTEAPVPAPERTSPLPPAETADAASAAPAAGSSEAPEEPKPESQTTGLANQVQAREVASGDLSREPEKGDNPTFKQIHAMGAGTSIEDAERLASQIKHGDDHPTAENFSKLLEGARQFKAQLRNARRAVAEAIDGGGSKENIAHLKSQVDGLETRRAQFLDDIQKAKGMAASSFHALQIGSDIDSGDYEDVIQSATEKKGSKLTEDERNQFKDLTQKYNESTSGREKAEQNLKDALENLRKAHTENEGHVRRISRLEKALAEGTKSPRRQGLTSAHEKVRADLAQHTDDFKKLWEARKNRPGIKPGRESGAALNLFDRNDPDLLKAAARIVHDHLRLAGIAVNERASRLEDVYPAVRDYFASDPELRIDFTREDMKAAYGGVKKARADAVSARDAQIKRLTKQIADLEAKGLPKRPGPKLGPDVEEIADLKAKRNAVIKKLREASPAVRKGMSAEAASVKRLTKRIADLEAGVKKVRRTGTGPDSAEVSGLKKKVADLQNAQKISKLRQNFEDATWEGAQKEREVRAQKRQADKARREADTAYMEQQKVKRQIADKVESLRPRTAAEKLNRFVTEGAVGRLSTGTKVIANALVKGAVNPIENQLGYIVKRLPAGGGRTFEDVSPSDAGGGRTFQKGQIAAIKKQWARARPQLEGRANEIDALMGDHYHSGKPGVMGAITNPGRVHAAFNTQMVTGPRFDRALRLEEEYAAKRGIEPTPENREVMMRRAAVSAMNDALRSNNRFAKGLGDYISKLERSPHIGDRFGSVLLNLLSPVRKLPSNALSEGIQYTGLPQIPAAGFHIAQLIRKVPLTDEEAITLARMYKKAGPAGLMYALVAAAPAWLKIGGFYQGKPNPNGLKPGEVSVAGHVVPKTVTNAQVLDGLNYWYTLRHGGAKSTSQNALSAGMGFGERIPGEMSLSQGVENTKPGTSQFLTTPGTIASGLVPGPYQDLGKALDVDGPISEKAKYLFGLGGVEPTKRDSNAFAGAGALLENAGPGIRQLVPVRPKPQRRVRVRR